jgi:hypothetical protein
MLFLLILAALLIVLILVGGVFYGSQRMKGLNSRPLVLIHRPLNQEEVPIGGVVIVHATARNEEGIDWIELWVDDVFITSHNIEGSNDDNSTLVLNTPWEPDILGRHVLIVRAMSTNGVEGQASVLVEVVENDAVVTFEGYVLEEDETFASVAADNGLSVDELMDYNPGITPENISAGDPVFIPGPPAGSSVSAEEPREEPPQEELPQDETPQAESPPPPLGEPPEAWDVLEPVGWGDDGPLVLVEGTVGLRVEVLALETDSAYESVHCYVGIAMSPPRWYPDVDGDQSTDESFPSLGDGVWDVTGYLSGGAVPTIYWDGNQPLPVEITCVGIFSGGQDAVDLGFLDLAILPEEWDGIVRQAESPGAEGSFTIDYQVTWVEGARTFPQSWEDARMTPPTNVWLNYNGDYLTWDYWPEEDEDPIDGFLVFLNDSLVWVVSPETRRSRLPAQWLTPPCGEEYAFTVRAYHYPYPQNPYSVASDPVVIAGGEPGTEACEQEFSITFHSLVTGNIPEDPEWENNWAHAVGPIHGSFYARDGTANFNWFQFAPNLTYEIPTLMSSTGENAQFNLEFYEGAEGVLVLGFVVVDENEGGNSVLCSGEAYLRFNDIALLGYQEGTILSYEGTDPYCIVTYSITPLAGSVVGGGVGEFPLPYLNIEDMIVDPATGDVQLHVRNTGNATWNLHDLDVRATRHSGDLIDTFTWPEYYLEVGQTDILEISPGGDRPLDICVQLDPDDHVLELYEQTGALTHNPTCMPLPDLRISNVLYDRGSEQLLVTLVNNGQTRIGHDGGMLQNRELVLRLFLADGSNFSKTFSNVNMSVYDEIELQWAGVSEDQRTRMYDGYTMVVDPDNAILEHNEDNNEYIVDEGARLRLFWSQVNTRYYPYRASSDSTQEQHFEMKVYITPLGGRDSFGLGGISTTRWVAEWSFGPIEVDRGFAPINAVNHEVEFQIGADEELVVYTRGYMDYRAYHDNDIGRNSVILIPYNDWGTNLVISEDQDCQYVYYFEQWHSTFSHYIHVQPPVPWQSCPQWASTYVICKVE